MHVRGVACISCWSYPCIAQHPVFWVDPSRAANLVHTLLHSCPVLLRTPPLVASAQVIHSCVCRPAHAVQVDHTIRFDNNVEPLLQWDAQIQSVCNKVNEICDDMAAAGIKIAV